MTSENKLDLNYRDRIDFKATHFKSGLYFIHVGTYIHMAIDYTNSGASNNTRLR